MISKKQAATKGWALFSHTRQFLGAIVFIIGILWWFSLPAVEKFIEKTISPKLAIIEASQIEQTVRINSLNVSQAVIIENQRIGEILDAEMRSDVKELLRLIKRTP